MLDIGNSQAIITGADPEKVLVKFLTSVMPEFCPSIKITNISTSQVGEKSKVSIDIDTDHIERNMDPEYKKRVMKTFAGDMGSLFWYSGTEITPRENGIEIIGKPDVMLKAAAWSSMWDYRELIAKLKNQLGGESAADNNVSAPTPDMAEAKAVLEKYKAPPVVSKPRGYKSADMDIVASYLEDKIKKTCVEVEDVEVTANLKGRRADIRLSIIPREAGDNEDMRLILGNILNQFEPILKKAKFFGSYNNLDISGNLPDMVNDIKEHDPVGYAQFSSKKIGGGRG